MISEVDGISALSSSNAVVSELHIVFDIQKVVIFGQGWAVFLSI